MAEINKFLRSRERILEILSHLTHANVTDENTRNYISNLKKSLQVIELKIEEFRVQKTA